MKIYNFKCPNCGATLVTDVKNKNAKCQYCGNEFMISEDLEADTKQPARNKENDPAEIKTAMPGDNPVPQKSAANPEKVAFVSVSFDRTLEALQNFVNENYLPGVQLFDPAGKKDSKVAADYGVKWIPSLYLIDETGKVQLGTVMINKIADALGTTKKLSLKKNELCSDESCAL